MGAMRLTQKSAAVNSPGGRGCIANLKISRGIIFPTMMLPRSALVELTSCVSMFWVILRSSIHDLGPAPSEVLNREFMLTTTLSAVTVPRSRETSRKHLLCVHYIMEREYKVQNHDLSRFLQVLVVYDVSPIASSPPRSIT